MKLFLTALIILTNFSTRAHALANEGRGGGDTVAVGNERRLLDLAEKKDLEYFIPQLHYGTTSVLEGIAGLLGSASQCAPHYMKEYCSALFKLGNIRFLKALSVAFDLDARLPKKDCPLIIDAFRLHYKVHIPYTKQFCFSGIDSESESAKERMESNLSNGALPVLKPLRWAFTNSSLEDVTDEGTIRVENPKTKKQVAIQIDDLVIINKKEFNRMDPLSKDTLFIHEAGLYALKKLNPALIKEKGTAPLRSYVNALVSLFQNPRGYPAHAVRAAFEQLGIEERNIQW